jgi:hypothetical protein
MLLLPEEVLCEHVAAGALLLPWVAKTFCGDGFLRRAFEHYVHARNGDPLDTFAARPTWWPRSCGNLTAEDLSCAAVGVGAARWHPSDPDLVAILVKRKLPITAEVARHACGACGGAYARLPAVLRDDETILMAALRTMRERSPDALGHASARLRSSLRVVRAAMRHTGVDALAHAALCVRDDDAFVEAAVRRTPLSLRHASQRLRLSLPLALFMLKVHGPSTIIYVHPALRCRRDVHRLLRTYCGRKGGKEDKTHTSSKVRRHGRRRLF